MLCNLKEVLSLSSKGQNAIAGFNVFGYEDAHAVVKAAEKLQKPVILMANTVAVDHMGIELIAKILCHEAEMAKVPVCVHLDHATELSKITKATQCGFSSVMIDASSYNYETNVKITKEVMYMTYPNISVEAEIGSVGYSDKKTESIYTCPEEAYRFAEQTKVNALAVAVGTVHRMVNQQAKLDFDLLDNIANKLDTPIVIHGATGVTDDDLKKLVKHGAQKINLGTTLRMAFGNTLRRQMEEDKKVFDRIKLFSKCMKIVEEKAIEKLEIIS